MNETTSDTLKSSKRRDPMARDLQGTGLEGYREVDEWAIRLNRSTKTIRRWMAQGLRHVKVAGAVFIADKDVAAFFESHAVGGNIARDGRRKVGA